MNCEDTSLSDFRARKEIRSETIGFLPPHLASAKWKLNRRFQIMLLSPKMSSAQTSCADFSEARAGI